MATRPVGDKDYPRTRQEFRAFFPGEAACLAYLTRLRWPTGFVCPGCGGTGWLTKRGTYACADCGKHTSPTAGTIFEGTRKPLLDWFEVAWRITTAKNGVSAVTASSEWGMSREVGWAWLHKFRRAMVRPDRDLLSGEVEADETFLGGAEDGAHGRQTIRKTIVVVMVEKRPVAYGRVRLVRVKDVSAASLHPVAAASIAPGATLTTDFHKGYLGLDAKGYTHKRINIKASGQTGSDLLPGVHLVASHLDRVWLGTHHGAIRWSHLDAYLDEFVFRFNRRGSKARGLLFYRLLEGAVATEHAPLHDIRGGTP